MPENKKTLKKKPKLSLKFRSRPKKKMFVTKAFRKEARKRLKRIKKQFKKKVSLFYKFSFFFFLISFVTIFYFVVLVSVAPKSFPFVTQKIQTYLQENIDPEASIAESHLRFTRYGTLRVGVDELKVFYASSADQEKQKFIIPRLEAEISVFNLLRFKMSPSKVKIMDARIVINNLHESEDVSENVVSKEDQMNLMSSFILAIREEMVPIKNFEIENGEFVIKGKRGDKKILVKRSKITSRFEEGAVHMHSVNRISFDASKPDVYFNANCKLEKEDAFKCGLLLDKFETASIVDLHPKLKLLEKVNSSFNIMGSFLVDEEGLRNVIFDSKAQKGSFEVPGFFSGRMAFRNLEVMGEYHSDLGVLNFSTITADFPNAGDPGNVAHLDMSAAVSNLRQPKKSESNFDITLNNVLHDEVEKFWPIKLNKGGVRDWVITHLGGGIVKDAYAKFTLHKKEGKTRLKQIDSEVVLEGADLEYSHKFPKITKINAVAHFTKEAMQIAISEGKVLDSDIVEANVGIDDLRSLPRIVKISGKMKGAAGDGLKHASDKASFRSEVARRLQGEAESFFDIQVPLSKKIRLQDVRIEVDSQISNVKSDYVQGAVRIKTQKNVGSRDFVTAMDLTDATIDHQAFDISKTLFNESGMEMTVSFAQPGSILFKDVVLWKKDNAANGQEITSNIRANIAMKTDGSGMYGMEVKNHHFGENDYSIIYKKDEEKSHESLSVKGSKLNLAGFIQKRFAAKGSAGKRILQSDYRISVQKLLLANGTFVNDFSLSLDCDEGLCDRGFAIGHYNVKDFISLKAKKMKGKKMAQIDGTITNIGYLAEALGISGQVSSDEITMKLTNRMVDGEQMLEGTVKADKGMTIFENETVKKLDKDSLFHTVKDKIFSSEKIVFDGLKIELSLRDKLLKIKSLVANNYKVGITAKGEMNLRDHSYDIKGMIIPGFVVNNLFGIGKVPVVGTVVTELLTGGNKAGGLFGIHYEYWKNKGDSEAKFKTNKVSAFVPTTIRNLFDKI